MNLTLFDLVAKRKPILHPLTKLPFSKYHLNSSIVYTLHPKIQLQHNIKVSAGIS